MRSARRSEREVGWDVKSDHDLSALELSNWYLVLKSNPVVSQILGQIV